MGEVRLAIDGGEPALTKPLRERNVISDDDVALASHAMRRLTSGYLGGQRNGGFFCEKLEHTLCAMLGVRHALLVNSATSGLLAACHALDVGKDTRVLTTPYTMSATAAVPRFLGARVRFGDIELDTFNLDHRELRYEQPEAVIVSNIFGHPAELAKIRDRCDYTGIKMIEDNAQSPFAMEGERYAGTIGHAGVFSFNVHKHFQCGEGGCVVTNDDVVAERVAKLRNHGELDAVNPRLGLNLRMTEMGAATILSQLNRRNQIIDSRIELAHHLSLMVDKYPGLTAPVERDECKHVYYVWALRISQERDWFVRAMCAEGVPMKAGYNPLHKLPVFSYPYPRLLNTEIVDNQIALFEVCAYDPDGEQLDEIKEAFAKVCDAHEERCRDL